ncbi:MAG: hypothetical protein PUE71_05950 [Clostridia bacterium]|nr:hypothetical protein [Clostridia bacterium]
MEKGRKIFWGVLFILGAAALLIGRLGYLEGFSFWRVLISIGLVGVLVDGIVHRNFTTILFSLAFLIIVYDKLLGLEAITPWPVLGAALLGSIGLTMIFPSKKNLINKMENDWNSKVDAEIVDGMTGEEITLSARFGEAVKYITGKELGKVKIESAFASLTVYFDNAQLKNGTASVFVNNSFASTVLYIPADWRVELHVSNTLGATQEKGHSNPMGTNVLSIYGDVAFGALEIRYV